MADAPERREGRGPVTAGGEPAQADELHLYFPIEIEVRTIETVQDVDAAVDRAFGKLASGIRSAG
jgi:hypothetical protein